MLTTEKELVFIESRVTEKKLEDGTVKVYRFAKFANPDTFENYSLTFTEKADFSQVHKGQRINLRLELQESFNRTNVQVVQVLSASK